MPLTRDFRETVQQRAYRDPEFRAGLYQGAVQTMLEGDFAAGRILLRDFINATIGFTALAGRVGLSDKSLMRMFGPTGNPHAANLLAVLRALGNDYKLNVSVEPKPAKKQRNSTPRLAA